MKNLFSRAWIAGFILVLVAVILGEIVITFDAYFIQFGMLRNLLLLFFLSLFTIASYIATFYSRRIGLLSGFSFILVVPAIEGVVHFLFGLWHSADFSGMAGFAEVLKIYLVISCILVTVGTVSGYYFWRRKMKQRCQKNVKNETQTHVNQ